MKTLNNHVILYDAECPMCSLYTGAFVKNGLLGPDGRQAYQHFATEACPHLDWQRAVNEIALINRSTGEVTYGIQSLLKVCGNAMPIWKPLFSWRPFLWLAEKAYAFVSYNRRVIVPAPVSENRFDYQPSFKIGYRLAWLVFTWLVTATLFSSVGQALAAGWEKGIWFYASAIVAGQLCFQGAVILAYRREKIWDYLGNLSTISLAGAMALLLLQSIVVGLNLGWLISLVTFLAVAFLMFLEHLRRCRLLGLGYTLSLSWVLYRLILLIILYCRA